jgi:hypothetical protein
MNWANEFQTKIDRVWEYDTLQQSTGILAAIQMLSARKGLTLTVVAVPSARERLGERTPY